MASKTRKKVLSGTVWGDKKADNFRGLETINE